MMQSLRRCATILSLFLPLAAAPMAFGFSVDGDGHYALRGETRTAPGFSKNSGYYQGIEQSFRLLGEARFNDQSSMYLELRLFDNPREAYLGDSGKPTDCVKQDPDSNECEHQSTGEPRYEPYTPKVTQAYMRYAFDYCIVEAGRRGRDWGLGAFLDSGSDPFETDASIFDGFSCDINIQKTSTLGFRVGYDKLAESGSYVDSRSTGTRRFGANDTGDDIDQYFFVINYDDRKANAGEAFTKEIGVYFAQVNGAPFKTNEAGDEVGGSSTDLKFLDLYTGFYLADFALRNEILFRMGKSADPNWQSLGGSEYADSKPARQKLDAIALAGSFDWTLSHSGAALGPAEYNRGDASRHVMFLNYAYAPGDEGGYYSDDTPGAAGNTEVNASKRDGTVKAIAFHRNYKPALILFNARPEADTEIVQGGFNPGRVVNATVFGSGYRFESMTAGNFEFKLVTASLLTGVPGGVTSYYDSIKGTPTDDGTRPVGFYGKDLGWELDLTYTYKVGREAELGIAAAAALPGEAWQTEVDKKPVTEFLLQTHAAFRF